MNKRFFIVLSILFTVGCQQDNQPQVLVNEEKKEHAHNETFKMVKRLQNIHNVADPMSNSFMNNERLLLLEETTKKTVNKENFQPSIILAFERLRAGNSEQAVELFRKILIFTESNPETYSKKAINQIRSLLAISLMRVGEQSNCIMLHGNESCIFPISQAAIHVNQKGSRQAIKEYKTLLEADPNDLVSMWLYNIASQTLGEYPDSVPDEWFIPMSLFKSEKTLSKFSNIALDNGTNINDLAGGTITEDFNNDGYLDIMASAWGTNSQIQLLINDKNGKFVNKTHEAGLKGLVGGLNMVQADYDNDGDIDVFVLRGAWLIRNGRHPNSLLRNNGDGSFTDVTESSGVLSYHPTQTAAWGDFDNDGWVDLFVGNESIPSSVHLGELYHNNGDGTFENVAKQAGLDTQGFVKGAVWGDYDNDGKLDLYVSNMSGDNQLFRNTSTNKSWSFENVANKLSVNYPKFSFPTWFWDFDNDGWLDIFVADFVSSAYAENEAKSFSEAQALQIINNYVLDSESSTSPRLYKNNGDGSFTDVTIPQKLNQPLLSMGANFGDLDNDGYLDMYIGTGAPDFRTIIPNRMFLNNKSKGFVDVTTTTVTGHLQKGHGISFADMDNDGDQDIYAVMGGAYSGDFFQNAFFENPGFNNNWITLKLIGTISNRSAIGARVEVVLKENNKSRQIFRTVSSGGSFGANSLQLEIGLGQAMLIEHLKIKWPSGAYSEFDEVEVNQKLQITEGKNTYIKK